MVWGGYKMGYELSVESGGGVGSELGLKFAFPTCPDIVDARPPCCEAACLALASASAFYFSASSCYYFSTCEYASNCSSSARSSAEY